MPRGQDQDLFSRYSEFNSSHIQGWLLVNYGYSQQRYHWRIEPSLNEFLVKVSALETEKDMFAAHANKVVSTEYA